MNWPEDRRVTYNPTVVWNEETQTWIHDDGRGGARYKMTIIVISQQDDGTGKIHFGLS